MTVPGAKYDNYMQIAEIVERWLKFILNIKHVWLARLASVKLSQRLQFIWNKIKLINLFELSLFLQKQIFFKTSVQ